MNLPSNCHCTADVLFKLPALDLLFRPDEQNEGAVGRSQHTVNLVDADVAVFCRFSGGHRHFEVDGDGEDVVHGYVMWFLAYSSSPPVHRNVTQNGLTMLAFFNAVW